MLKTRSVQRFAELHVPNSCSRGVTLIPNIEVQHWLLRSVCWICLFRSKRLLERPHLGVVFDTMMTLALVLRQADLVVGHRREFGEQLAAEVVCAVLGDVQVFVELDVANQKCVLAMGHLDELPRGLRVGGIQKAT